MFCWKFLEQFLDGRDQGANQNPRIGKRSPEPAGSRGAGGGLSARGGHHGIQSIADAFDGGIEGGLVLVGRANEIFESGIHTISLFFSLLCVNLVTKTLLCNPFVNPRLRRLCKISCCLFG